MSGSVRVIDHGWNTMMTRVRALSGGIHAKVGVLADTKKGGLHEKDSSGKSKRLTVAEIAAIMEFGTRDKRIPARPFIVATFDRMKVALRADQDRLAADILFGKVTAQQAMNILGAKLAAEIKKTVTTGPEIQPTNAPSTKRRKEAKATAKNKKAKAAGWGVRTLVDTGRMIGAVTWVVVGGMGRGDG